MKKLLILLILFSTNALAQPFDYSAPSPEIATQSQYSTNFPFRIVVDNGSLVMNDAKTVATLRTASMQGVTFARVEVSDWASMRQATVSDTFFAPYRASMYQATISHAYITDTLQLPTSEDPDVGEDGQISHDTDGWLRVYDNATQKAIRINKDIQFAVADPDDLSNHDYRGNKSVLVWYNNSGMTYKIATMRVIADAPNTSFRLFESASRAGVKFDNETGNNSATILTVTASVIGADSFVSEATSFIQDSVRYQRYIIFEYHKGTAATVHVYIDGWYMGDTN